MPPRSIEHLVRSEQGFESSLLQFVSAGLLSEADVPRICGEATTVGATYLNVNPGFRVAFNWSLSEAAALDKAGAMVEAVREKANQALRTWSDEMFEHQESGYAQGVGL